MSPTYDTVKALVREHPEWLPIIRACCDLSQRHGEFAGAWVEVGYWFPSLRPLASRGILERMGGSRGGKRAYYRMPDREGVAKAVAEL